MSYRFPVDLGIGGLDHAVEIGSGASAVVYRATQADLDREVAVKVLSTTDEAFVRRFRREAKTLGKLSLNPGIVTVHGTGVTADGQPYLILELCQSSVLDHLRSAGRFEVGAACRAGAQVADALAAAHAAGVVHRDIKPGNILRSQTGTHMIADFGISTVRGSTLGQTDAIGFTAGYVAPEILKGDEPNPAGDVYALGATLFHMLSGRSAFADPDKPGNLLALAHRVVNDPLDDLRLEGIPDDVCRIIEAAMAKHPTDRPTATQLRDQLHAVAGGDLTMPGRPALAPFPNPGAAGQPTIASTPFTPDPGPGDMPTLPDASDETVADFPFAAGAGYGSRGLLPEYPGQADSAGQPVLVVEEPVQAERPRWLFPVLAGVIVALVAIGGLIAALGRGGDDTETGGQPTETTSTTVEEEPPVVEETTTTTEAETETDTVELVDFAGQMVDDVRALLEADGLEVEVLARQGEAGIPGVVTGQRPPAGTMLGPGALVSLFIPAEAELVIVPDVTGTDAAAARTQLEAAGLVPVDGTDEFDETVPEGAVIRTVPEGAVEVEIQSEVLIVASRGPAPPTCTDVIDSEVDAAVAGLESAGLSVTTLTAVNAAVPDGIVFDCVVDGNLITLVAANGPPVCSLLDDVDMAAAADTAAQKGFTVEVTEVPTSGVTPGDILACSTEGNVAQIDVAVALPTTCPASVAGSTQAQAQAALTAAGFADITFEEAADANVAEGQVISCVVADETATVTVSIGPPAPATGQLTVSLNQVAVQADCAGDGLRPNLYGTVTLTYAGDERSPLAPWNRNGARTPTTAGVLALGQDVVWEDVSLTGQLAMSWDLTDADVAPDEDGMDDPVSTTARQVALTGTDRAWMPVSDNNDACSLQFQLSVVWVTDN